MDKVKSYIEKNKDRFLNELFELLRIPSISAQSDHKPDMTRCAEWLAASLMKAGADHAEVLPTEGNPVVFAERIVDPKAKTVLVYGHYDVMPVDPRDEWRTEPFEPVIRDGRIWGRGADDDKGQLCLVVTFARDITVLTQLQEEMTAQKKPIEQFHDRLAFLAREQTRELVPVFESREMKEVMSLVERFASSDATVLILGETGVGKDVVARLTHELSPRKEKMFLKVDCGGISESLTESELFGYMPGAFTGAGNKGKSGYFEMADGGTVFLDEIGELSLAMQTRLLRVLQDGEIMRVGSSKPRKVNVRIIAATNRNLAERVEKGLFRRDLYYRLNVAVVNIPPLRERPDDIQPLVTHFLNMFTSKYRKHMNLTPGLMEALRQYSWPGNVRELQNLMHSIVITKDHGPLSVKDLPRHMTGNENEELFFPDDGINYERPLKDIMADIERGILRKALKVHGSVQKVAEVFKVNRSTIFRKLHSEKDGGE